MGRRFSESLDRIPGRIRERRSMTRTDRCDLLVAGEVGHGDRPAVTGMHGPPQRALDRPSLGKARVDHGRFLRVGLTRGRLRVSAGVNDCDGQLVDLQGPVALNRHSRRALGRSTDRKSVV